MTEKIESKERRGSMRLSLIISVPYIILILLSVGVTGLITWHNSTKTVVDITTSLRSEIIMHLEEDLRQFLNTSYNLAHLNGRELNREDQLDSIHDRFWSQLQVYQRVSAIFFANEQRDFVGVERYPDGTIVKTLSSKKTGNDFHTYTTDIQGNILQRLMELKNYNPKVRPYYKAAMEQGKQIWTDAYLFPLHKSLYISVVKPLYDVKGGPIGVTATALNLSYINRYLQKVRVGKNGKIFIIERSGLLLGSSTGESMFHRKKGVLERQKAISSTDPLVRTTARFISERFSNPETINTSLQAEFMVDGEKQLLHIKPFSSRGGIDWLIILVVPEIDYMENIHATTRNTIFLTVTALLLTFVLGIFIAGRITQPIIRLCDAAGSIAAGNWNKRVDGGNVIELNHMANSFNGMAGQLQDSFDLLETRVTERTRELQQINVDLKEAKEKAESANRAKSAFLANMSHELRTPLNSVLGFSKLISYGSNLEQEQKENLGIIIRSGEYLLALINDVLEMAKIEVGRTVLNEQDIDLIQMLEDLRQMFCLKAEKKGVALVVEYSSNLPHYIHSDGMKLRQILINLLNNALKFTQKGSVRLSVNLQSAQGMDEKESLQSGQAIHLSFEVADTGIGIGRKEKDIIFEAFKQAKSHLEGTGLGLPISRHFVRLMGGELTLDSEEGRGSSFLFSIKTKVAEIVSHYVGPHKRAIGLEPGEPQRRLLIVDDIWDNRKLLEKTLKPMNFNIREAANGREAVEIWKQFKPDLIFMDMRMPVMSGLEAVELIRATEHGERTVIVAVTASAFEEERGQVLEAGCDDFIRKPYDDMDIFRTLEKYLQVQFIYDEIEEEDVKSDRDALSPVSLAGLPSDLLKQLELALKGAEMNVIASLIEKIREHNDPLANALSQLTTVFKYDEILAMIDQVGEQR